MYFKEKTGKPKPLWLKMIYLFLGIIFIILGFISGFLPILPGFVFILIGIAFLAKAHPPIGKWFKSYKDKIRQRFQKHKSRSR